MLIAPQAFAALTIGATTITTDGNLDINGVAAATYTLGAATATGTITIGGTAQTGNLIVGQSSGTNSILIGSGTGATTIALATGSTSSKVGIGIASPAAYLHILGTTEQLRLGYDSSNYTKLTVGSSGGLTLTPSGNGTSTYNFTKADGTTSVLNIDMTNGRVGINTTQALRALEVWGSSWTNGSGGDFRIIHTGTVGAATTLISYPNQTSVDSAWSIMATGAASIPGAGKFMVYDNLSLATRFLIDTSGKIGIGTTNPGATLDVKGHYASSQTTAPTASVTGTGYSGSSMVSGSTDTKGSITATVGANAGTLVVTFQTAYASAPACTVTPSTATAQVDIGKMYSTTSTTALTINFAASPTGGSETWTYICLQ